MRSHLHENYFASIIIGLAWVIVQTMITPYSTFYVQGSKLAGNHFPAGAMIVLLFMTFVVNVILRKMALPTVYGRYSDCLRT